MTEANTAPEANTTPEANPAMDPYTLYMDKIAGRTGWKNNALPPSQADVAVALGKLSTEKK